MKDTRDEEKYRNIKKNRNINELSREEIISKSQYLHSKGEILEAKKYYKYFIDKGFKDSIVFSNYGLILKDLGQLKEAEFMQKESIKLNPKFANAHSNLGNLLREMGQLKEAEIYTRKAIKIKPDFAMAYSNLGLILKDLGKLQEAEISIFKAIKLKPKEPILYFNLGIILESLGKLKEAEIYTNKAIELKPNYAEAYLNLGCILIDLGKLKEAEALLKKSIDLESNLTKAYFSLSTLKYSKNNKVWQSKLFSENILNKKSKEDLIHIYFARANILHKDKKYKESSKYLSLANSLKLELKPSKPEIIINKSNKLMLETYKEELNFKINYEYPESIFIVGMPRSGSTLLESILSINKKAKDLGEINILEESYLEWKKIGQSLTLAELYWERVDNHKTEFNITTNKWLYNYQYTGIIAMLIPNSKIIHCFRNPLDNILSIYRAHFAKGNQYSSSLIDCVNIYLHQDEIMSRYKSKYRSKIYDLNYDKLVCNPNKEIKSLLSWLDWKWDDSYLTPHLNQRSVSTASSVQVRSPIHSKSIGIWKNYKNLLKMPISILTKTKTYKNINS